MFLDDFLIYKHISSIDDLSSDDFYNSCHAKKMHDINSYKRTKK